MMQQVPYRIPRPNHMGLMRYILALFVFVHHFNELLGIGWRIPYSSSMAVGGFFALSGYLMTGSYLSRPGVRGYLLSRCRRLLPAYWSVVLLGALGLAAVSTLPASDYFGSGQFWRYLGANLAFANFIEPSLPGVFADNIHSAVNGSLWTMKVEWFLYLTVPVVIPLLGRRPRRVLGILAAIYILSALYRYGCLALYESTGREIFNILMRQFAGMLMYFYAGVYVYYWLDTVRRHRLVLVTASVAAIAVFHGMTWFSLTLEPLAVTLAVLGLSLIPARIQTPDARHAGASAPPSRRLRYLLRDNVSYNVYLIHFPVMQTAACYGLTDLIGVAPTLAVTLAVTFILSYAINLLVERPILLRTAPRR